jgi:hypothetical protein
VQGQNLRVVFFAGYFDHFPPKDMNVKTSTKEIVNAEGSSERKIIRRFLVAEKDFKPGEVIYKVFCGLYIHSRD